MKCTKEKFQDLKHPDDILDQVVEEFNHGGRTHYIVSCPIHGEHKWVGKEWGVIPNQPALGWVY